MKYVAIYLRLSIEDQRCIQNGLEQEESSSISNQRKQIYEYIHRDAQLSRCEVVEFCDDGYSGTNMQRPGMQRLLKEIKGNQIQCIIVKDMSRFSRDYIEMGNYLNQIFPFMGIRFIAINDHYDSKEHQGCPIELDTAFRTLLYDLYSKDVSVKVKSSFANKCEKGEYVFGQVPFGYEKSKEVKNAVVINEKEASVVRYIFSLAVQGMSSTQIARALYGKGVPTIMQMRKPERKSTDGKIHSWSPASVRKILNNRFYLGEMAYGKTQRKSVGSKSGIAVPRDKWKVIKGHHEALISEEIFQKAASVRPEHDTKRKREKHPLTGKLYCGGCGYAMSYKPLYGKNRYRRFECKKHALFDIPECCTYMSADALEETVLLMLNHELMLRGNAIQQKLVFFQEARLQSLKKKKQTYQASIKKTKAKMDMLYESYALGRMTEEVYKKQAEECTRQISFLSAKAEETVALLAESEREYQKREDMEQRRSCLYMEELTQEAVELFIKKIYAYRDKRIEIEWNFVFSSSERELPQKACDNNLT